ncbi:MAG: alpha-amylase family glycosyl hydrolase, partial [Thermotogota bacterium]
MDWWKKSIAYQIYPKSFKDSNNDGKGDIQGIISKLDYLQDLGVDLLWISPIYPSPMKDNGYDVSNYYAIDKTYGSMEDFDELLEQAHERNMRIVMDLVINHTSNEHPWFIASSSSKENPYRDYYYWRDGKNGEEPNNWAGYFHETAWTYDKKTNQ